MNSFRDRTAKVTAIVPAFKRVDKCIATLEIIQRCVPPPAEIIVHVDDNQVECADQLRAVFPNLKIVLSIDRVGPGGARNAMISVASQSLVASFDDDSFPLDSDYFERIVDVAEMLPDASIIGAVLYHPGEKIAPETRTTARIADFQGGACVYRRDTFKKLGGYLPIAVPYGIEEVDLALRCCASNSKIYRADWLRVYHDNDRSQHAESNVTAASIVNIAVLAFLRYPILAWPIGIVQILNRLRWLIRVGRSNGIVDGLTAIPFELIKRHRERNTLPILAIINYLRLRKSSGDQNI